MSWVFLNQQSDDKVINDDSSPTQLLHINCIKMNAHDFTKQNFFLEKKSICSSLQSERNTIKSFARHRHIIFEDIKKCENRLKNPI